MSDTQKAILGVLGAAGVFFAGLFAGSEVETPISSPPETPDISAPCPDGWEDKSSADEHTIVLSCERNNWLVVLNPDGSFSHGVPLNTAGAGFVFDPREVAEWPAR
jgi:hypothetical protein